MTDQQQEKAISEAFEEVENMSDEQIESFTRFSSPPEDWEDFMIAMTPKQAEAFERWLLSHEQKIAEKEYKRGWGDGYYNALTNKK